MIPSLTTFNTVGRILEQVFPKEDSSLERSWDTDNIKIRIAGRVVYELDMLFLHSATIDSISDVLRYCCINHRYFRARCKKGRK